MPLAIGLCSIVTLSAWGQDTPGSGVGATTRNVAPPAVASEGLPSAEEVIENFIKATGGRDAYGKLHDRVIKGTVAIPQMNVSGTIQIQMAEPNLMHTASEFPGAGKQRQGVKDGIGWEITDMGGARLLEGPELASAVRNATFNAELKWKELYKTVECAAAETINGKKTYKLVFTPHEGAESSQFYDAETHLLVKARHVIQIQMGDVPVETDFSDYRDVDGIKLPYKTIQTIPNAKLEIVFSEVKHNVDLAADTFDLPEEVQKLVEKKKARESQPAAPAGSTPTPKPPPPPAAPGSGAR
jgi:hypothetical protein